MKTLKVKAIYIFPTFRIRNFHVTFLTVLYLFLLTIFLALIGSNTLALIFFSPPILQLNKKLNSLKNIPYCFRYLLSQLPCMRFYYLLLCLPNIYSATAITLTPHPLILLDTPLGDVTPKETQG